MYKIILPIVFILFFLPNADAFQLAELKTETAEDLLLFFDTEELMIATRHETSVRKAPAIATVITAKEIRNMGARDLLDILRRVPGLGISIHDMSVYKAVEIRGIRTTMSEKVLFMVDGHSVNNAINGNFINTFLYLSADAIKRVEVIRGPGSALYGANAFLGVINVVTKKAEDINGLQVTAGAGSFDTQHYNLMFGHEGKKLKISGYVDYLNTDGQSHFIEEDSIGNSGKTDVNQEKPEMGLYLEYGNITLNGGYLKNRGGIYIGAGLALNDESVQEWEQYYLDVAYSDNITDKTDITARLYGDFFRANPYWEVYPEGYMDIYTDGMIGNTSGKEKTLGAEIITNFTLTGHLLTLGGMFENKKLYDTKHITNYDPHTFAPLSSIQDVSDGGNFIKNADRDIFAVYIQDIWEISNNASLTAGIRHDQYSDFGGTTNPRAGLVWEFIKDTSLKLLYGRAFRAPSFSDLYQDNNPSYVGNEDIEPEEIKTYEAGIEHRFLDKFNIRLNYFHTDIKNLIAPDTTTLPTTLGNIGSAEIDGIETEFLYDLGDDYYGYVNYSYQDARDGDTGKTKADVPSHRANAGINLAPSNYLNANVNISWTGERPRADGDTRDDLSSDTLVDLTLIAKNFHKALEIRGSAYNLFNEDYRDPSPSQVPNDYPTNERMFLLEARYTF